MREPTKLRSSTSDNIIFLIASVFAIATAEMMDQRGMPQKWHAAIVGTLLPFAIVIMNYRRWWLRWFFWASLAICFFIHIIFISIFFQYAIANVQSLGILAWTPIAFVETFVVIVAVKKLAEKIAGKRESVRLS
jgi:hypothetical protein